MTDDLSQPQVLVRPVAQVSLDLKGQDSQALFQSTRELVLKWIQKETQHLLSPPAWRGESFEIRPQGDLQIGAVGLEGDQAWIARVSWGDWEIPQRTWTTEVLLSAVGDDRVFVRVDTICLTRGDHAEVVAAVPSIVSDIVAHCDADVDGRKLVASPWLIETREELEKLVELMGRRGRIGDVVVMSLPRQGDGWDAALLSADELCARTLGAAHVAVITAEMSDVLSGWVGKPFSVVGRCVRIYHPGFDPFVQSAYMHPLIFPLAVKEYEQRNNRAYIETVITPILTNSLRRQSSELDIVDYYSEKRREAERRLLKARAQSKPVDELLTLAEEEIAQLHLERQKDKQVSDQLLADASKENGELKEQLAWLQEEKDELERQVAALAGQVTGRRSVPDTLDDFEDWCKTHLSDVVIHSRALQGVKKSKLRNVSLIYRTLLVLQDMYVPLRRSSSTVTIEQVHNTLAQLGLYLTPSISTVGAGMQGEDYYIDYGGQKHFLDWHVKNGGNTWDPTRGFRLYFCFDHSQKKVIVGWMTTHLGLRR